MLIYRVIISDADGHPRIYGESVNFRDKMLSRENLNRKSAADSAAEKFLRLLGTKPG